MQKAMHLLLSRTRESRGLQCLSLLRKTEFKAAVNEVKNTVDQLCEKEQRNMERFANLVGKFFEGRASNGMLEMRDEAEILKKEVSQEEHRLDRAKREINGFELRLECLREENRKLHLSLVSEQKTQQNGRQTQEMQHNGQQECKNIQVCFANDPNLSQFPLCDRIG